MGNQITRFVEGKEFEDETIKIDNTRFQKCVFTNCKLDYSGGGPVALENCKFNNVNWHFSGAAANTLEFLSAMYNGMGEGGRKLVKNTFNQIKQGND